MIFKKKPVPPPTGPMPHHLVAPSGRGRRVGQAALFDRIIERIKQFPGRRHLVDLGCGAGILSLRLAETCPDLRITGLESSSDLVRLATHAASEAKASSRVSFTRSDLKTLPISDKTVDLLVGAQVLGEASSPQGLLAEVARVLVPGGIAILVEPMEAEGTAEGDAPPSRTEVRIRRLVSATPQQAHATFARTESGATTLLEITLTAPLPEPPSRGQRRS